MPAVASQQRWIVGETSSLNPLAPEVHLYICASAICVCALRTSWVGTGMRAQQSSTCEDYFDVTVDALEGVRRRVSKAYPGRTGGKCFSC